MQNTYLVYDGPSEIDGSPILAFLTLESQNKKTGNIPSIMILVKGIDPTTAIKLGLDYSICGNCPLRGIAGKDRACYVNVGQSPTAIRNWYDRHNPPVITLEHAISLIGGRLVRCGSYGDMAMLPLDVAVSLAGIRSVGYTHQWRDARVQPYKKFLMASCDTLDDVREAKALGWRVFYTCIDTGVIPENMIECPAGKPGKFGPIQCRECGLCSGISGARDIAILPHGPYPKMLAIKKMRERIKTGK